MYTSLLDTDGTTYERTTHSPSATKIDNDSINLLTAVAITSLWTLFVGENKPKH